MTHRSPSTVPSGPVTDLDVRNIDPTTVELSWGPVMAREQNGIILSYNIYYEQYDNITSDYFTFSGVVRMVCEYVHRKYCGYTVFSKCAILFVTCIVRFLLHISSFNKYFPKLFYAKMAFLVYQYIICYRACENRAYKICLLF